MLFSVCLWSRVCTIQCMFMVESLYYLVYVYGQEFELFSVCLWLRVRIIQCMFMVESSYYSVYVYG